MLEDKYMKIIKCLRKNSRESLTNISKKINVPISTVYDRIKNIEDKFVNKHTSLVNFEKIGFPLRAKILIASEDKNKINEFVSKNRNINSAFGLDGKFNFLLDCVFKDTSDFNIFISQIDSLPLHSKEVCLIKDELKREEFLV